MFSSAKFSPCRTYRYALYRRWAPTSDTVLFICLNPSTADESVDDPTVRRCIAYAKAWGFDGMAVGNLFAYRATQPADMRAAADPIGPDNDAWLRRLAADAQLIVAAWGEHGTHRRRADIVRAMLPGLHCLRLNKSGQPAHPARLPGHLRPQPL